MQIQSAAVQYFSKILSFETHGPHPWGVRAEFDLSPSTFWAQYVSNDGATHFVDTRVPYAQGQWYGLSLSLDLRGPNPMLTWQIGGLTVSSVTDSSSGSLADMPVAVRLGFGPRAWGASSGTLTFDQMQLTNAPAGGASPPTATPTSTPTVTSTPTPTSTQTSVPTDRPTPTITPTATDTPTASPTPTITPTPTDTPIPTDTPTPTVTPTATDTPTLTATPTATATSTLTPTPSSPPTLTPTATSTSTATPTATSTPGAVLLVDGFEGTSFASTGWSTDVAGTAETAALVTSPVFAGN